eukprot:4354742-Amphidinium_carterae.3
MKLSGLAPQADGTLIQQKQHGPPSIPAFRCKQAVELCLYAGASGGGILATRAAPRREPHHTAGIRYKHNQET